MVERGLAESRTRAQALILAGRVRVNGQPSPKPGTPMKAEVSVEVLGAEHPWVSRGGVKLAGALDHFGVDPTGWVALDVGASTGGFTDVLLSRGAVRVFAIDVGHNQLHWKLRQDPRVVSMEGLNARHLDNLDLPCPGDGAVIDVSFISLDKILPALRAHLRPEAPVMALVKPQFELGPEEVGKGGIVRDQAARQRAVDTVAEAARALGYTVVGQTVSSLPGTEGNVEHFLHLRAPGGAP